MTNTKKIKKHIAQLRADRKKMMENPVNAALLAAYESAAKKSDNQIEQQNKPRKDHKYSGLPTSRIRNSYDKIAKLRNPNEIVEFHKEMGIKNY